VGDARHLLGRRGEDAVARWLAASGWTVLARRWRCAAGELDLVVRDPAGTLVAVEVKVRTTARAGSGAESVDHRRLARLRAALSEFARHAPAAPAVGLRIDLVTLSPAADGRWRLRRLPSVDGW
jgi:putative endonuclease